MVRDRPKHFFLKRLGSRSLYIAAPKVGRAEVPAGSTGGEGAVGRPQSHEADVFFGLAKSFRCDESPDASPMAVLGVAIAAKAQAVA